MPKYAVTLRREIHTTHISVEMATVEVEAENDWLAREAAVEQAVLAGEDIWKHRGDRASSSARTPPKVLRVKPITTTEDGDGSAK